MRIAEIFRSLQGEGRLTGVESVFVRASGCNLRCRYCDTPYASWTPEGEDLSVDEIVSRVESLCVSPTVSHAVVTGGEPMLFAELIPLCSKLRGLGKHVTIETAGTLYLPVECDLMSISPKLSNSFPLAEPDAAWLCRHEHSRYVPAVVRRLLAEYDYQLKFVIDRPADCEETMAYLAAFPGLDRSRVMLMPQGTDAAELSAKARWLEPYCAEHKLQFCPRRHIEWFGSGRGK
jgi:7-carboxy-7-deazaguanine synthase